MQFCNQVKKSGMTQRLDTVAVMTSHVKKKRRLKMSEPTTAETTDTHRTQIRQLLRVSGLGNYFHILTEGLVSEFRGQFPPDQNHAGER